MLWLLIGLTLVAIYSTLALPKIYKSALRAIAGAGKCKALYALEFAALLSAAAFLLVFTVATFAYQCACGLKVGLGKAAPFALWTIFVFIGVFALLFCLIMVLVKRGAYSEGKIDLKFILPKIKLNKTDKLSWVFDILFAIAILMGSVMLALMFDYGIYALFGAKLSKRLVLLIIISEIVLITILERKKLKKLKDVLPRTIIPILLGFIAFYVVLVAASEQLIEWIFMVGGSSLIFDIALFYIWSLIVRNFNCRKANKTKR